jgi:hypothetical protein
VTSTHLDSFPREHVPHRSFAPRYLRRLAWAYRLVSCAAITLVLRPSRFARRIPSDMARIQKRQTKSGATVYVVKWRTSDGADRTKGGFSTRKAANAYATKVEGGKLRGVEFDPKAGGITFREAAAAWLASRHDRKPTTLAGCRKALAPSEQRRRNPNRLGNDAVLGSDPLNAIKREQIQNWVAQLTAAGKSPVTRAVSHGGTDFRARGGYALAKQHAGAHISAGRVARR